MAEKSVDLAVVRRAAGRLRAAGFEVVVSRWSDTSVAALARSQLRDGLLTAAGVRADVTARVACANAARAQLLLSVHMDAYPDPQVGGTATIYEPERSFAAASRRLARLAQTRLIAALRDAGWPVPDRGASPDAGVGTPALTAEGARYGHLLLLGPAASGWLEKPSQMPGPSSSCCSSPVRPRPISRPASAARR